MTTYQKTTVVEVDDDPPSQVIVLGKNPGEPASCHVILGSLEHRGTLASLLPLGADRTTLAALLAKVRANALAALGATVKP